MTKAKNIDQRKRQPYVDRAEAEKVYDREMTAYRREKGIPVPKSDENPPSVLAQIQPKQEKKQPKHGKKQAKQAKHD